MPILYLLIIILACFASCEERSIILPNEDSIPQLVAIGHLIDGERMEVAVSNTASLDDKQVIHEVPEARVVLYKGDSLVSELYYDGDAYVNCDCSGFVASQHISEAPINVEYGSTYRLEVSASGYPTLISEELLAERKLTNISFDATIRDTLLLSDFSEPLPISIIETVYLKYFSKDVEGDRVKLELYLKDERRAYFNLPSPEDQMDLPLQISKVDTLSGSIFSVDNEEYRVFNSFTLELIRYPAEYNQVWDKIFYQTEDISGLYASSPTPVPTNMKGGYGYFVIPERYAIRHEVR